MNDNMLHAALATTQAPHSPPHITYLAHGQWPTTSAEGKDARVNQRMSRPDGGAVSNRDARFASEGWGSGATL
eukprot:15457495-Alexandrium_andersonii.AAC.1